MHTHDTHSSNSSSVYVAISTAVKDSWKFAAVEICDLLHQVRDSGLEDIQFMEGKINNLLASMHEQSEVIDKQNDELQLQKQVRCNNCIVEMR